MYKVNASIKGTSSLLQHAFGQGSLDDLQQSSKIVTGTPDYSLEWMHTMYILNGYLVQPANHIEGSMQRAAASFKMKGKGGKSWKDAVKAYAYVAPDMIVHYRDGQPVSAPEKDLLTTPRDGLSISIMRVKVQRAAVARSRLMIDVGWELNFQIDVSDDQVPAGLLQEVLSEAGRAVGIGDYRPRYGRFEVTCFEKV